VRRAILLGRIDAGDRAKKVQAAGAGIRRGTIDEAALRAGSGERTVLIRAIELRRVDAGAVGQTTRADVDDDTGVVVTAGAGQLGQTALVEAQFGRQQFADAAGQAAGARRGVEALVDGATQGAIAEVLTAVLGTLARGEPVDTGKLTAGEGAAGAGGRGAVQIRVATRGTDAGELTVLGGAAFGVGVKADEWTEGREDAARAGIRRGAHAGAADGAIANVGAAEIVALQFGQLGAAERVAEDVGAAGAGRGGGAQVGHADGAIPLISAADLHALGLRHFGATERVIEQARTAGADGDVTRISFTILVGCPGDGCLVLEALELRGDLTQHEVGVEAPEAAAPRSVVAADARCGARSSVALICAAYLLALCGRGLEASKRRAEVIDAAGAVRLRRTRDIGLIAGRAVA